MVPLCRFRYSITFGAGTALQPLAVLSHGPSPTIGNNRDILPLKIRFVKFHFSKRQKPRHPPESRCLGGIRILMPPYRTSKLPKYRYVKAPATVSFFSYRLSPPVSLSAQLLHLPTVPELPSCKLLLLQPDRPDKHH